MSDIEVTVSVTVTNTAIIVNAGHHTKCVTTGLEDGVLRTAANARIIIKLIQIIPTSLPLCHWSNSFNVLTLKTQKS
jgi:hypothetical protein